MSSIWNLARSDNSRRQTVDLRAEALPLIDHHVKRLRLRRRGRSLYRLDLAIEGALVRQRIVASEPAVDIVEELSPLCHFLGSLFLHTAHRCGQGNQSVSFICIACIVVGVGHCNRCCIHVSAKDPIIAKRVSRESQVVSCVYRVVSRTS